MNYPAQPGPSNSNPQNFMSPGGPPPRPPRQTGLIVSICAFVVMLGVFLVTGLVAPGFLRGDDEGGVAVKAQPSTTSDGKPSEHPSAPPSENPSESSQNPSESSQNPSESENPNGFKQDDAYMQPMRTFVARLVAKDAADANRLACKDDKSQRLVRTRAAALVRQNPKLVEVTEESGLVLDTIASLRLKGTVGGREIPKVKAAGTDDMIYSGGVTAGKEGGTWCIQSFVTGFTDVDGE